MMVWVLCEWWHEYFRRGWRESSKGRSQQARKYKRGLLCFALLCSVDCANGGMDTFALLIVASCSCLLMGSFSNKRTNE